MARRGPQAVEIVLSEQERVELSRWAGDGARPRMAERARIVLACAEGESNTAVAAGLNLTWHQEWSTVPRCVNSVSENLQHAANMERLRELVPLRRFALESEVARTVIHAIDNEYMTGNVLEVDGGSFPGRIA